MSASSVEAETLTVALPTARTSMYSQPVYTSPGQRKLLYRVWYDFYILAKCSPSSTFDACAFSVSSQELTVVGTSRRRRGGARSGGRWDVLAAKAVGKD